MNTQTVKVSGFEKTVVKLLSDGSTITETANHVNKNRNTLATDIRFMHAKYGVKNSTHLVAYFLRNNLIK